MYRVHCLALQSTRMNLRRTLQDKNIINLWRVYQTEQKRSGENKY